MGKEVSDWKKSSRCGESTHCVEVWLEEPRLGFDFDEPAHVLVRDSKNPSITLRFTQDEWLNFITATKNGAHDL